MRYLFILAVCGVAAVVATAVDETKADTGVREIEVKGVKLAPVRGGQWAEPTVIKSEEELTKVFGEEAVKAIEVDFKKEYLALFRWAGSGQDKLTHAVETKDGKTTVTTTMMRGRTKDLRQHVKLIALPAGAVWVAGK